MPGTILLCAGGTGGHLFPAEALAHELKRRGWTVFLATDERARRYTARFPVDEVFVVPAATIGGSNPFALIGAMWTIWRGVREATRVINRIRPGAVVGFGGYPTLPPLWAATRRRVPTLIHEQNAVMGRANRALAGQVDVIAGGFLADEGPYADKIVKTGNPVRPAIVEAAAKKYRAPGVGGRFRLLVFGGSQGARFFSDTIPAAVAMLPDDKKARLSITQQAREEDQDRVRQAYDDIGVEAEISPFFTDMPKRIADAHLVISRSGASTVAEIAAIGRPAILVPYPYALDHDQAANAEALARSGGAEVHAQNTLDEAAIAAKLAELMDDPDRLVRMASAARSAGKPDAVHLLADAVEAIASGRNIEKQPAGEDE